MNEIEPTTQTAAVDVLAGAWSVDRHLSPLALFEPNRTQICAQYQLALIDDTSNEARAHILAARRHLQAARTAAGTKDSANVSLAEHLRVTCVRLDELARCWD